MNAHAQLATTWSVWRIDDTGNTFLVRSDLSHEAAVKLAAEFERRGHKQMYWVEADATPLPGTSTAS